MFDRISRIFDLLEVVKERAPLLLNDVVRLYEDLRDTYAEISPLFSGPLQLTMEASGQRPHRIFKEFVRHRVIRRAVNQTGKDCDAVAACYDKKITNAILMKAASESNADVPLVGGSFSDWFKSIDWAKVLDIISKILAVLIPILLAMLAAPVSAGPGLPTTSAEVVQMLKTGNERVQSAPRFLVSDSVKSMSRAVARAAEENDLVASAILAKL